MLCGCCSNITHSVGDQCWDNIQATLHEYCINVGAQRWRATLFMQCCVIVVIFQHCGHKIIALLWPQCCGLCSSSLLRHCCSNVVSNLTKLSHVTTLPHCWVLAGLFLRTHPTYEKATWGRLGKRIAEYKKQVKKPHTPSLDTKKKTSLQNIKKLVIMEHACTTNDVIMWEGMQIIDKEEF